MKLTVWISDTDCSRDDALAAVEKAVTKIRDGGDTVSGVLFDGSGKRVGDYSYDVEEWRREVPA